MFPPETRIVSDLFKMPITFSECSLNTFSISKSTTQPSSPGLLSGGEGSRKEVTNHTSSIPGNCVDPTEAMFQEFWSKPIHGQGLLRE